MNSSEHGRETKDDRMYKNKNVSLVLCIFLGYLGVHKFYEGKIGIGIAYLLTMGFFGIGWIYDIIKLASKPNPYIVEDVSSKVNADSAHTYNSVNQDSAYVNAGELVKKYPTNKVQAIKELREQTGMSLTEAKNIIDAAYPKKFCPKCGGINYHAFVEEVVIREGKVKSTTSLNLNPLKPFTVFNHKEKVVRKPWTRQVSKFVCDDCGKIFQ